MLQGCLLLPEGVLASFVLSAVIEHIFLIINTLNG